MYGRCGFATPGQHVGTKDQRIVAARARQHPQRRALLAAVE